jgi:hypothetical protein
MVQEIHMHVALGPWCWEHGGVDGGRELAQLQITEADLVESGPRVRALQVARLEQIWGAVNARLQLDAGGEQPIDPRLLEIGLRVIKEEAAIYRLGRIPPATGDEEQDKAAVGGELVDAIEAKLAEIESKLRAQPAG